MLSTALKVPGEAWARSAISRAYYAAFHVGNAYLTSNAIPLPTGRGGKHAAVIRGIRSLEYPEGLRYAGLLQALKELREQADYARSDPFVGQRTEKAIRNAEVIIRWIERLS